LFFSLFSEISSDLLQFHRVSISQGEWWRLITAHLVHLGWGHLIMNLIGLWLIWHLFYTETSAFWCVRLFLLLAAGISAGLWFYTPDLIWYRGLSGVLHGLLCWALLSRLKADPLLSTALLLGVVAKIGWEQWQGPMPGSESLASGRVVVASHLYGAVTATVMWLLYLAMTKIRLFTASQHDTKDD
jgi:rhomboid family GlyGly-CTERM serine protease